jgi:hypothetical protein
MTDLAEATIRRALRADDIEEHPSQFAPMKALWCNGREIANFAAGAAQVRLTRAVIRGRGSALRGDDRIEVVPSRDWVTVRLTARRDVDLVAELVGVAADAHRSLPARVLPGDRALAGRRRAHGSPTDDLA